VKKGSTWATLSTKTTSASGTYSFTVVDATKKGICLYHVAKTAAQGNAPPARRP